MPIRRIRFESFANSRPVNALVALIGKTVPPRRGYAFADTLADFIANRRWGVVRTVRANQWVVSGETLAGKALDHAVHEVFRRVGHNYYDTAHLAGNIDALCRLVHISDAALDWIQRTREGKHPAVFALPHLSNFDLVGRALVHHGLDVLVLSVPQPPGGFRVQNRLRRKDGLNVRPISVDSLREATKRLASGGSILTGNDRPLPPGAEVSYRPCFFGRPAPLPVMHVRLALKARAPVVVIACKTRPDGEYEVDAVGPIAMKPDSDLDTEVLRNAEAVLEPTEDFIRANPRQWAMFHAVWPETMELAL